MNNRRPLLNLSTEVDINVRDFGHDLAAIKAAFARAAKTSLPCRVVFEKRTYVLKGHAERHALTLAGLKNVRMVNCGEGCVSWSYHYIQGEER